jgi:hypothetical protein
MRITSLSFGATLLATALIAAAAVLRDEALEKALEGAWCNSFDGGKTCWGYDEFSSGKITSCGRLPQTKNVFTAEARYEVKGTRVCSIVTAASRSFGLPVGERFCVEVLDINERAQRFRSLESGNVDTIFRVPRESVRCPKVEAMTPNSSLQRITLGDR